MKIESMKLSDDIHDIENDNEITMPKDMEYKQIIEVD
jgi:hypothetical protein